MSKNPLEEITEILADRQQDYGDASRMLVRISLAWSGYLGREITPDDVTRMMSIFKILRATGGTPGKNTRDDDLDAIGYLLLNLEKEAENDG